MNDSEKQYQALRAEEVYEFIAAGLNQISITREMAEKMKTLIEIHTEVDYAPEAR